MANELIRPICDEDVSALLRGELSQHGEHDEWE